ncbi:glycoside hydrolase family 2 protein [Pelagicoccus mobilis]|uniref:Beta-galactosidase n=1 Tax=Pelagicoccus mobilis TaxID=415221 RepID=A0A934RRZ9_9BACT|nr:sugar-binding domain-containing protein [Pelagicoccus mobilis]MBK1875276.1 hypothetical protein [Pelagicoccus mobilis]
MKDFSDGWLYQTGQNRDARFPDYVDHSWVKLDATEAGDQTDIKTSTPPRSSQSWYRKHFSLPADFRPHTIALLLGGTRYPCKIYLNGHDLGYYANGNLRLECDLTPYIRYGQDETNVIAINLIPDHPSEISPSHVSLNQTAKLRIHHPVHIRPSSVRIETLRAEPDAAVLSLEAAIVNNSREDQSLTLYTQILNTTGEIVAEQTQEITSLAQAHSLSTTQLVISQPKLWQPNSPDQYLLVSSLLQGELLLERHKSNFGIRTLKAEAEENLIYINDQPTPIKGVSLSPCSQSTSSWEKQLSRLQSSGVNMVRTTDGLPSLDFIETCDKLGILVQIDTHSMQRTENHSHQKSYEWQARNLRQLIGSYRNNPSVIAWNLDNAPLKGVRYTHSRPLVEICLEEDGTRPINLKSDFPPFPEDQSAN